MDEKKNSQFHFLLLINKCILLFEYIDIYYQQEILNNIKNFIKNLEELFSKKNFETKIEKKNKILEVLITYFEKLIYEEIIDIVNTNNKEHLYKDIENRALLKCKKKEKKIENVVEERQRNIEDEYKKNFELFNKDEDLIQDSKKKIYDKKNGQLNLNKSNGNLSDQSTTKSIEISDLIELEKKINLKIKNIFNDIEHNIKTSLKDYISYTEYVEYDLDKKFDLKIENIIKNNNIELDNKIKELIKNNNDDNLYENINDLVKYHINDIYKYIDYQIKNLDNNKLLEEKIELSNEEIENKINDDIDNKIKLLGNIVNNNIKTIFNNLNNTIIKNEEDLLKIIEEKININTFNKNNFDLEFDKEQNEINFYYCNELITSTKLNIKGLIGPKGPPGNIGEKGDTPIFRKISFDENNKIKFIIQDNTNIYEIISDESIPLGPQGIQGIPGEPGRSIMDLKWDQDNVMRIDEDNKDSLIFLKSLCVGEKSHCLKNNSIAIGGGICYQNNSFALGQNSKTLDSESIALYGSSIGKKAFAYRADNVDENTFQIGKKDKNNYNINSVNINSKEINLDCDILNLRANKYENNKFNELEERIISIEKKIIDIFRKI